MADFAKRLKEERLNQNLTQSELAEKMNVHYSYISQIENRRREPSLWNFRKLVKALDVSADYLLGRSEE